MATDRYQLNPFTNNTATTSKNLTTTKQISTQYQNKQKQIRTKKNKFQRFGITVAGGNGYGQELNQLSDPWGMFIDNDKSIYIADLWNNRIVKWKLNLNTGEIIAGENGKGTQNNQLNSPTDIIYDKENNSFIISEWKNQRVIRYFDQNQAKQQIIIANINCWGLTIDKNGYIYTSNCNNNEVRRWKQGNKKGKLVAGGNDWANHRVMKWKKDAKEGIIVAGGNGQGNSLKQLCHPQGVFVDHLGKIYMADSWNHRVMRWCEGKEEGEIVVGGNGRGNQPNQLDRPMGLAFDNEENLYVVDHENYRVQKYEKILN
ncbi:unnamed protein product [Adineta steineri]|uniref:NHL repeat containing protein n=1 Tax=Adineta steineri TaxID=433720 RepID=A0A815B7I8_9BILA|nr:unnamed protein product [Adineta steineri]